ncbi:uncharacterized protein LOC132063332 [Lycium ferocissimum]|uniref:uncharacterized protein LOC132063332 n=1 Tax=Lycium ferocissimum TaxID=112874 RepID=UPI0028164653|nr:uncharacterized protein LOC132063332 [Lycium ferocissimum]
MMLYILSVLQLVIIFCQEFIINRKPWSYLSVWSIYLNTKVNAGDGLIDSLCSLCSTEMPIGIFKKMNLGSLSLVFGPCHQLERSSIYRVIFPPCKFSVYLLAFIS